MINSVGYSGSGIPMQGDGGPMMQGTWINPQTGNKFTVKDSFIEDGQFIVITTDGRRMDYNTIQNYVQAGPEVDKDPGSNQAQIKTDIKESKSNNDTPQAILDELKPGSPGLGNLYNESISKTPAPGKYDIDPNDNIFDGIVETHTIVPNEDEIKRLDPDFAIIDRILGRQEIPTPIITLQWNNKPSRQLDAIVNILGVPVEKVADYYMNKIDNDVIHNSIAASLAEFLANELNHLNPEPQQPNLPKHSGAVEVPNLTKDEINDAVELNTVKKPIRGRSKKK